ncbi:CPBP family intramembrane glutamic endopeptidase [Clostridium manihotivorum]|uniref:CPBP family intramembrane metalloprotease domain-containing protein n=1 Tax=Clostridium manihotivorum TaxID=2320868 RepID=A0A410E177_9CLOT|nr:type II CAAX endopeptidase family protein [Clostridium manihotivorum]QAA35067.1 CPBP family intramembrane metalloprotease domain-containing protein [Clostridium manihotivorum]
MKPVFKSNLYFFIVLLVSMVGPYIVRRPLMALGFNYGELLMTVHALFFLVPAVIYVVITKASVKETFRFNKISGKEIGYAILIAILSQPVMTLFSLITSFFFDNDVAKAMNVMRDLPYWMMLLVVAVTPAITEEITMRGIVLSGYNNKSKLKASLMIGLLFGIFHLNGQQFLYAAALGALFAYMVRVTNSIFVSMICHFTVNGIQVTMQALLAPFTKLAAANQQNYSLRQLPLNQKINTVLTFGFIALIFAALVSICIKKLKEAAEQRGVVDSYELALAGDGRTAGFDGDIALEKDNIINIPFIATVIIYLVYMIFIA